MQATTRSNEIAAELRNQILCGQYRSGERLPSERDLAERFGVHRGAVREAFKCLEQLGIAVIRPGGARVAPLEEASLDVVQHLLEIEDPPDPDVVDQVLEVMSGLFSMAARLAAERAGAAQRAEILESIAELGADDGRDMTIHIQRVERLGDLFVEAADNLVMRLVRRGVKTQFMQRGEPPFLSEPPPRTEREPHLKRLAAAVEARDGREAAEAVLQLTRAMRAHLMAHLTERRAEAAVPDGGR